MAETGMACPTGITANRAKTGAKQSMGASWYRKRVRPRGSTASLVSILRASAARKGMPPRAEPKTLIRLAPIRFWIMADHLRSATVSSAAEVMSTTSISSTRLATEAP